MTRRPHDALFKRAFERPEHLAQLCRELLPPALVDAIAWDTIAPQPGAFIDPALKDFHSDILFKAEFLRQSIPLYVLVEHQSTVDPIMPLRILHYLALVWMRHAQEHELPLPLPPLVSVLVAHAPGGWPAARSTHDLVAPSPDLIPAVAELVPNVTFVLDDLSQQSDENLRGRSLAALPKLALWLLKTARNGPQLLARLDHWRPVLQQILAAPSGIENMLHLLRYVALVAGEVNFAAFHAKVVEALPESEEVVMTIAEELRQEGLIRGLEQGREQGLEQGREQGLEQGRIETLTKLLTLKFGPASQAYLPQLEQATRAQLDSYVERILIADTLDELFAEL